MNKKLQKGVLSAVFLFSLSAIVFVSVSILENVAAMATGYVSPSQIFYSVSAMALESLYIYAALDVCRKLYNWLKAG